ncbi:MAG: phosphoadenylyl-sulfate reductase [Elusimicrobia bacterium]|nr:phosphoadenylyl-sulfate reductase [Elusimicrobiota bacterium]
MNNLIITRLQEELKNLSALDTIKWSIGKYGVKDVAFASSFGAEDQVITDMLIKINPNVSMFTLDTGLLPKETRDLIVETEHRYNIAVEILKPETAAVENMIKEHGASLFYESIEKRKLCCRVRKIEPLKKKLVTLKAWICGLRKEQSITRSDVQKIEWDEAFGLFKINPLADWTEDKVWKYIKDNNVPYNKLHDKGYPSIGCAPCTRAVRHGEDVRAGRWWWETSEQKECGLHVKNIKTASKRKI